MYVIAIQTHRRVGGGLVVLLIIFLPSLENIRNNHITSLASGYVVSLIYTAFLEPI